MKKILLIAALILWSPLCQAGGIFNNGGSGGGGGGGNPGGNSGDVQFNSSGSFGGSDNFTYDADAQVLKINDINTNVISNITGTTLVGIGNFDGSSLNVFDGSTTLVSMQGATINYGNNNLSPAFSVMNRLGFSALTVNNTDGNGNQVTTAYNMLDKGDGQMGVGMQSPNYALDIEDSGGTTVDIGNSTTGVWGIASSGEFFTYAGQMALVSNPGANQLVINAATSGETQFVMNNNDGTPAFVLAYASESSPDPQFYIGDNASRQFFTIDYSNGKTAVTNQLAIGTNTPNYAVDILDIGGTGFDIGNSTEGTWSIDGNGYIQAANITTGASAFNVDTSGNITKLLGQPTNFPSANASGALVNDGSGNFSYQAVAFPGGGAGAIQYYDGSGLSGFGAYNPSGGPLSTGSVDFFANSLVGVASDGSSNFLSLTSSHPYSSTNEITADYFYTGLFYNLQPYYSTNVGFTLWWDSSQWILSGGLGNETDGWSSPTIVGDYAGFGDRTGTTTTMYVTGWGISPSGAFTGASYAVNGGNAGEFLKGDGSLDSNAYVSITGTSAGNILYNNGSGVSGFAQYDPTGGLATTGSLDVFSNNNIILTADGTMNLGAASSGYTLGITGNEFVGDLSGGTYSGTGFEFLNNSGYAPGINFNIGGMYGNYTAGGMGFDPNAGLLALYANGGNGSIALDYSTNRQGMGGSAGYFDSFNDYEFIVDQDNTKVTILDRLGVGMTTPSYPIDVYDRSSSGFDIGNSTTGSWSITNLGLLSINSAYAYVGVEIGTEGPGLTLDKAAPHSGQATCWTDGGVIGYCTGVVDVTGACPCSNF